MSKTLLVQRLGALARNAPGAASSLSEFASSAAPSFKLPDLPYSYNALEPYISAQIMEIHHSKHHATYVANLNKALEAHAEAEHKRDVAKMVALQESIKFNGGGEPGFCTAQPILFSCMFPAGGCMLATCPRPSQ